MTSARWNMAAACLMVLAPAAAGAQTATPTTAERVAAYTDWAVFVADEPKECYIVTPPTGSVARRDGSEVEVNRGDIRLFVTFRPGDGVSNEVSFTSGYPLRDGSNVDVVVGSEEFAMNIGSGDANSWAWPASPEQDAQLIDAMRRGSTATVTGISSRGTTTVDTFSLMGFTAAINDAEARCR